MLLLLNVSLPLYLKLMCGELAAEHPPDGCYMLVVVVSFGTFDLVAGVLSAPYGGLAVFSKNTDENMMWSWEIFDSSQCEHQLDNVTAKAQLHVSWMLHLILILHILSSSSDPLADFNLIIWAYKHMYRTVSGLKLGQRPNCGDTKKKLGL